MFVVSGEELETRWFSVYFISYSYMNVYIVYSWENSKQPPEHGQNYNSSFRWRNWTLRTGSDRKNTNPTRFWLHSCLDANTVPFMLAEVGKM